LKSLRILDLPQEIARDAASLRFQQGSPATNAIDAIVVATADVIPGTAILTGDYRDLAALASVRKRSSVVRI